MIKQEQVDPGVRRKSNLHETSLSRKVKAAMAVTALSVLAACSGEGSSSPQDTVRPGNVKVTIDATTNPTSHESLATESERQKLRNKQLGATEKEMLDRGEHFETVFKRAQNLTSEELVKRGLNLQVLRFKGTEQHTISFVDDGTKLSTLWYPDYDHRDEQGVTPKKIGAVELSNPAANSKSGISFSNYGAGKADASVYFDLPIFEGNDTPSKGADYGDILRVPSGAQVDGMSNIDLANRAAAFDKATAETGRLFTDQLVLIEAFLDK